MRTSEATNNLRKLLSDAQLPALPQSAIRLLELFQDPDNGPAEFAVPIESDPGLASQVLQFVNSSYFGFRQEISSVKLAITLVGIRTIKNFALWNAVFSLMPNPQCGPFDLKSLWQDSLRRAIFARATGTMLGLTDAEDLFAVALLQDMAIPLLAKELPSQYQELLDTRGEGKARLSELEEARFGWTHAEAGGIVARVWSLPDRFALLIEGHADVETLRDGGSVDSGEWVVKLSGLLPSVCDDDWAEREQFTSLFQVLAGNAAVPLSDVFGCVDGEFAQFAPVLKLSTPAKSLAQALPEIEAATV